jgi:positive regulator of sigma E activity
MDHAVEQRRATGGEPVALRPALRRWLALLLGGVAAAVLLSWVLLAVVHVDDRYLVNAGFLEDSLQGGNSSVWMAQASAGQEAPYPPLYDGRSYGGSRYAPLPLLAWEAAASLTGDYLVAGKLLTYLVAVALLGLAFAVTRRLSRSTAVAVLLTSSILVAVPGLVATASTPRGDAMALLFQFLAVVLVDRSSDGRACAGAGALCALAVFSKLSAVWGPLAIVVWLLLRDRRRLPLFLGIFAVLSLALFGAAQLLSDGRMLANFQATLFADTGAGSAIAPLRLLQLLAQAAPATALLVPFSLLAVGVAAARRELNVFHLALLCALVVLTAVLTDGGAQANHLIDVVVLVPVVVGDLWSRVAVGLSELSLLAVAVGLVAVWAVALGYGLNLQHDLREAVASALGRGGDQRYDAEPLRGYVDAGDAVLSEDPYVPLSIGQRPVVLDPWMLAVLGRRHPGWVTDLARRVDAQEFDGVVLAQRLETAAEHYRRTIFGEPVMSAVCRRYRFAAQVRGYWLYVPAEPKESLARAATQGPNNCSPRG